MNIIIGQYVPGKSLIHHLDPRAKVAAVFVYVIIIFFADNWLTYTLAAAVPAAGLVFSGISMKFIYRGLRPVFILILITFLLNLFLNRDGALLYQWHWLKIYEGGLIRGFFISIRLAAIIVMTTILTLTTTPIEVTDALESLLVPLKKIKFPVHEFALMMAIALRFIPTLLEETEKIRKAQTARGADFTSGPIIERLKAVVPLLVPLFVSAFKRAEDLAMAMEARGYRGDVGRTKLRKLTWEVRDTLLIAVLVLLALLLIFLR